MRRTKYASMRSVGTSRRARAAVLLGALIAGAAPAATAQAAAIGPHISAGTKSYVLTGTVVSATGKVVVEAAIWPNHAHSSTPGEILQMQQLDAVVTGSGKYRIRIPAASVAQDHVSRQGSIDVRLVISDGATAQIQEITARTDAPATVNAVDLASKPKATVQRTLDDVAQQVSFPSSKLLPGVTRHSIDTAPASPDVTRRAKRASARVTFSGPASAVSPDLAATGCYLVTGAKHGPYNETFTRVYGTSRVKGSVDQKVGSTHTIGVAVKGSAYPATRESPTRATAARKGR